MVETPATPVCPFQYATTIRYALGPGGLEVELRTRNIGSTAAPYGIGFHPWLSPGDSPLDEASLQVAATRWVRSDERWLPTGVDMLPEGLDFSCPRVMGY